MNAFYNSLKEIRDHFEKWIELLLAIDEPNLLDNIQVKNSLCDQLTNQIDEHEQ